MTKGRQRKKRKKIVDEKERESERARAKERVVQCLHGYRLVASAVLHIDALCSEGPSRC